jgi:HK97 family phage prohead protease
MPKAEKRFAIDGWQTLDFQVRAVEDGDGMTFEGYAAVFNTDSDGPIPGWGVEQIAPGAFSRSLKSKRDIKMFLNHNSDLVLASRNAGTLDLAEDDTGLLARAHFIDTTVGTDTAKNVKAGNVSKMSFGFNPERYKSSSRDDGTEITVHQQVQLWEVSPVTSWPAYAATSAFVRHLADLTDTDPEPLSEALRVLTTDGETLTDEQTDLLLVTINSRSVRKLVAPETVAILSRVQSHEAELAEYVRTHGLA